MEPLSGLVASCIVNRSGIQFKPPRLVLALRQARRDYGEVLEPRSPMQTSLLTLMQAL